MKTIRITIEQNNDGEKFSRTIEIDLRDAVSLEDIDQLNFLAYEACNKYLGEFVEETPPLRLAE